MKEEPKDLWLYENEAFSEGFETVCGVDEAGRGPLAGPVCAAAVILPKGLVIDGLNDSKKLTDKKRRELYDLITQSAVSYGIAMATEQEIDEINILQATFLAMQRALDKLAVKPGPCPHRRQPREGLRASGADHRQRRQSVCLHCRGVHSCQSHARPTDGAARRAVSAIRLRRPQGLRHQAALCCAARVWSV